MSHVIVFQVIQLQLLILANFQQYILNILTERMSKALKKEGKEVFKWAEALKWRLSLLYLGPFRRFESAIRKISSRVCIQA